MRGTKKGDKKEGQIKGTWKRDREEKWYAKGGKQEKICKMKPIKAFMQLTLTHFSDNFFLLLFLLTKCVYFTVFLF